MMGNLEKFAIVLVVGICAGLGIGWGIWRPKPAPIETAAVQVRQGDSSLVLERAPDANAKPAQEIPKGAKVERVVQVTVQPRAQAAQVPAPATQTVQAATSTASATNGLESPAAQPASPLLCPPVRVDLSLLRMPDQTRRVVASSPDGAVVGGVDIPVEAAAPTPRVLKYAIGGIWNPRDKTAGGFVDRDLGPLRLGVEGVQQRLSDVAGSRTTWAVQLRAGLRF